MALEAANLTFGYRPGVEVLRDISATFEAGVVTAVVGPNGAGKSTLLRLLSGVLRPVHGTVAVGGRDLGLIPTRARARRIAYVTQRPTLAFAFSLRQYIRLGRYAVASHDDPRSVDAALEQLDLASRAEDSFHTLSAGQQQRAAVALAVAQLDVRHSGRPCPACGYTLTDDDAPCPGCGLGGILLLDEPVSAMDPRHALETLTLLRRMAARGVSVITVLHDLTLVSRFCDRAVVLNSEGKVASADETVHALKPEILHAVFGVRFSRLETADEGVVLVPMLTAPGR